MVTSATSAARLATAVPTIFYDCQKSLATHRKNTTALVKVYQKAVANGPNDEKTFLIQFITCVRRLLPLKKAVPAAEKVVKFVDTFLKEIAARGKNWFFLSILETYHRLTLNLFGFCRSGQ